MLTSLISNYNVTLSIKVSMEYIISVESPFAIPTVQGASINTERISYEQQLVCEDKDTM